MIFNKTALALGVTSALVLASCSKKDDETPANTAPVISSAALSGEFLTASASDTDNDSLSYIWSVNGVTIGSGTSMPVASAPSTITGIQTVKLTVSDGTLSATSDVPNVDFGEPVVENNAPMISAAYIDGAGNLTAVASDDDEADSLDYIWSIDGATIGTGETLNIANVASSITGVQTVDLTVSDGTDEASHQVLNVNFSTTDTQPTNTPPRILSANASTTDLFATAEDSEQNSAELTFTWSISGSQIGMGATLAMADVSSNYTGAQTVLLTVSDGQLQATRNVSATFPTPNTTPVNSAPRITSTTATTTHLLGEAEDTEQTHAQLTYTWSVAGSPIGTGSVFAIADAPADITGLQTVTLTVFDGALSDTATVNATFPTPVAENTAPRITSVSATATSMFANADDDEDDDLTYTWSYNGTPFGTGQIFAIADAPATFEDAMQVTVTVSDGEFSDSDTVIVDFGNSNNGGGGNSAPVITSASVSNGYLMAAATDADMDNLTYTWSVDGSSIGSGESFEIAMASISGTNDVLLTVTDGAASDMQLVSDVDFGMVDPGDLDYDPNNEAITIITEYDGAIDLKQAVKGTAGANLQTDGNPFEDSYFYLSPDIKTMMDYSLDIVEADGNTDLAEKIKYVQRQPSAIWMDSIATITAANGGERRTLEGHLDAALMQQAYYADIDGDESPMTIVIIVYNLPDRDCAAYASNGKLYEIGKPQTNPQPGDLGGMEIYRNDYIGKIKEVLQSNPDYQKLRVVALLEPDSYPNMITNTNLNPDGPSLVVPGLVTESGDSYCDTLLTYTQPGLADGQGVYGAGLQIAINELDEVGNVYQYLDIGHAGWLGWDNSDFETTNLKRGVDGFLDLIEGANANGKSGFDKVRGFASNTSGYTPVEEPLISNSEDDREELMDWYQWNQAVDELSYIDAFSARVKSQQSGYSPGFIIDTARNGWGAPNRPTPGSGSKGTNSEDRVDRRPHRGHWCNPKDAGVGEAPKPNPVSSKPHLDAFFWMKPPGEADGISFDVNEYFDGDTPNSKYNALDQVEKDIVDSANLPVYEGKKLDSMCVPGSDREMTTTEPFDGLSPHAGAWFHYQFIDLIERAYPPLGESDYD